MTTYSTRPNAYLFRGKLVGIKQRGSCLVALASLEMTARHIKQVAGPAFTRKVHQVASSAPSRVSECIGFRTGLDRALADIAVEPGRTSRDSV